MALLKNSPEEKFDNAREETPAKKSTRWPSFSQWSKLPSVLSKIEKIFLSIFVFLFFASLLFIVNGFYIHNTETVPASGGSITEGIVGFPRFINPVYSESNDADRDLVELIFSGLLNYSNTGTLIPDLAHDFTIEEGGTSFVINLKENVQWHDGERFDADDVIFTIETIQDPKYKSPIRANWIGVRVERVSDFRIRLKLPEPYTPFLERLTLKILPSHIWEDITPENFALSPLNLQPVGTGPYTFVSLNQERSGTVKEITLRANKNYHAESPFIQSVTLRFFATETDLIKEALSGKLDSFALNSPERISKINTALFFPYTFSLPRYFALFFNLAAPDEKFLKKDIRAALVAATDTQAIQTELLKEYGRKVSSPLLPELFGFDAPTEIQQKDLERATQLLENAGYKKENGKFVEIPVLISATFQTRLKKNSQGQEVRNLQTCLAEDLQVYPEGQITGLFGPLTEKAVIRFQEKYAKDVLVPLGITIGTGTVGPSTREKLNEICFQQDAESIPLQVSISTVDQFPLVQTAQLLKEQWEAFGVEVDVMAYPAGELEKDVLKPRDYQTLLFGEILGTIPDPFPFWHSSQIQDPGLNLSSLEDDDADKLLEKARKEGDLEVRAKQYAELQDIILAAIPALFLYDMNYTYFVSTKVWGITEQVIADPSKRFVTITEWYIKTERSWR
ncbi:hypothetical protein IID24_00975 [Patescibacteria group bacterium]|nr:hypothetical protein [Patescibacteria group bacterium]